MMMMGNGRCRGRGVQQALLLLSALLASITIGSSAQVPTQRPPINRVPQTYILPVLRYGPNNQKRDLRQMAAIAQQLDMGLVLTGIFTHYLDWQEIQKRKDAEAKAAKAAKKAAKQSKGGKRHLTGQDMLLTSGLPSSFDDLPAGGPHTPTASGFDLRSLLSDSRLNTQQIGSQADTAAWGQVMDSVSSIRQGSTRELAAVVPSGSSMNGQARNLGMPGLAAGVASQPASQPATSSTPDSRPRSELAADTTANATLGYCFPVRHYGFMPFESVLDRSLFEEFVPVTTVDELMAQGWDGAVDAVVYRNGKHLSDSSNSNNLWHIQKTLRALGLKLPEEVPLIQAKSPMRCKPEHVQALKANLKPYRVVVMLLFVLDDSEYARYDRLLDAEPPEDACKRSLFLADRLCRPAPWLQQVAHGFIQEKMGGQPYLAVHVRPYPDECLDQWKEEQLNDTHLAVHCAPQLRTLHKDLAAKVSSIMQDAQLKQLFVMAHPKIRKTIDRLLDQEGLRAVYLDEDTLFRLAGCADRTATFMAMNEEEICVHGHTFLGTASSSITHAILMERLGPLNNTRNVFFDWSPKPSPPPKGTR